MNLILLKAVKLIWLLVCPDNQSDWMNGISELSWHICHGFCYCIISLCCFFFLNSFWKCYRPATIYVYLYSFCYNQNCLQAPRSWLPTINSGKEKVPLNRKKSWAGPGSYGSYGHLGRGGEGGGWVDRGIYHISRFDHRKERGNLCEKKRSLSSTFSPLQS